MPNYQLSNLSNKSLQALSCAPAILHVQIKFKAATYCHASSLMGYLHLVDQLQTDRFLSPEFEITTECLYTCSSMGAIWWGTRETCPPQILDGGDIICHVPPTFFS